jgi:hypothetical protein
VESVKGWLQSLFLGDLGQNLQFHDLQTDVAAIRRELDRSAWDERQTRELAERVLELHLRLGMLVRLLIAKGMIGAEEYASLIAASRPEPQGDSA